MNRARTMRGSRVDGSAILSALIVVALAALLVSGLLWREEVQIRRIENLRQRNQALWIERGALDYSRLILRAAADAQPQSDYLGEVWSMPLAATRLSDFLGQLGIARGSEGAATILAGQIEDAQSRFNLADLATTGPGGTAVVNSDALAALQRLLASASVDPAMAQAVAQRIVDDRSAMLALSGSAATPGAAKAGLPLSSLDGLLDFPGFDVAALSRLRPWLTILPLPTPVNANTAPAEVIAAIVPGMQAGDATAFVAERERAYFRNLSDVSLLLAQTKLELPAASILDVRSHYFLVHARVRHERAEVDRDALVYRDDLVLHSTRILSVSDQ